MSQNSSTDSFYDISMHSISTEESFANRIVQMRRENPRIYLTSKIKICIIVVLFFCLISYIIYNYYYEIVNGLNKTIL